VPARLREPCTKVELVAVETVGLDPHIPSKFFISPRKLIGRLRRRLPTLLLEYLESSPCATMTIIDRKC
jgi:hypothetical protein